MIGYVENDVLSYASRVAHFIVLEKYEDGVYTVFNPWNKKNMAVNEADIRDSYNYTYLDDKKGKLLGYYSFS